MLFLLFSFIFGHTSTRRTLSVSIFLKGRQRVPPPTSFSIVMFSNFLYEIIRDNNSCFIFLKRFPFIRQDISWLHNFHYNFMTQDKNRWVERDSDKNVCIPRVMAEFNDTFTEYGGGNSSFTSYVSFLKLVAINSLLT